MNTFFSGLPGSALLFVLTLVSGIVLSHSGKPYPSLIFTIHKLIAVGTVFILVRNIYRLQLGAPVAAFVGPGALLITGLLFATLVVSGALLSLHDGTQLSLPLPLLGAVHTVHQIAPVLALVAAGLSLRLLITARAG